MPVSQNQTGFCLSHSLAAYTIRGLAEVRQAIVHASCQDMGYDENNPGGQFGRGDSVTAIIASSVHLLKNLMPLDTQGRQLTHGAVEQMHHSRQPIVSSQAPCLAIFQLARMIVGYCTPMGLV